MVFFLREDLMCQAHLASVSPECFWCFRGCSRGLGNYSPHADDCPTQLSGEAKTRREKEILEARRRRLEEKQREDLL